MTASTVRRRSLAAEVHPTINLKAATYGDNLKITVCLVSSFTSSCSGNRDWYSATWGLSIRLPSRSWKYRNATLGVLMDCKKKTTSPTCTPWVTLFSNQSLPDHAGNNSCYGSRSTQSLHRANNTPRKWEARDNNKTLPQTYITMWDTCILQTGTLTIPSAPSPKRRSFSFKETATGVFLLDSLRRERGINQLRQVNILVSSKERCCSHSRTKGRSLDTCSGEGGRPLLSWGAIREDPPAHSSVLWWDYFLLSSTHKEGKTVPSSYL